MIPVSWKWSQSRTPPAFPTFNFDVLFCAHSKLRIRRRSGDACEPHTVSRRRTSSLNGATRPINVVACTAAKASQASDAHVTAPMLVALVALTLTTAGIVAAGARSLLPAFGIAFATSVATSVVVTNMLRRLKQAQQPIRSDGPQSHKQKPPTPTAGGILFVPCASVVALATAQQQHQVQVAQLAAAALAVACVGLLDDLRKLLNRSSYGGLPARVRLALEAIAAALLLLPHTGFPWYFVPHVDAPALTGVARLFFGVFVAVATTNGANLTDGLDGLNGGVSALSLAAVAACLASSFPGVATVCASMAGVSLGFVASVNRSPARVFMGDTGSLPLGFVVGAAIALGGIPVVVAAMFCGVYAIESLSVILQVAYFKRTGGARLFRMAPLHHHFELQLEQEEQRTPPLTRQEREIRVVLGFWAVQAAFCLVGLMICGVVSA
ncbi:phospho-N-acetylmuramoyl-pentapeptide-transferase MraY [Pycnococcus provasolii]